MHSMIEYDVQLSKQNSSADFSHLALQLHELISLRSQVS